MAKASEVIVGLVIGGVLWFVLSLLGFIPIVGWIIAWFIAPIVGGYEAGKYGGGISVLLLALLAPAVIAFLGFSLLSMIEFGLLRQILGMALGLLVSIWAMLNLLLVGVGGAMGVGARKPKQVEVQLTGSPYQRAPPVYAPTPQPQIQSAMLFCRHCGARSITPNTTFCPNCGKSQT